MLKGFDERRFSQFCLLRVIKRINDRKIRLTSDHFYGNCENILGFADESSLVFTPPKYALEISFKIKRFTLRPDVALTRAFFDKTNPKPVTQRSYFSAGRDTSTSGAPQMRSRCTRRFDGMRPGESTRDRTSPAGRRIRTFFTRFFIC